MGNHTLATTATARSLTPCLVAMQAVSEIIRTTLGPRSMLKMLLDPMGGIVITNDGTFDAPTVSPPGLAMYSHTPLSQATPSCARSM